MFIRRQHSVVPSVANWVWYSLSVNKKWQHHSEFLLLRFHTLLPELLSCFRNEILDSVIQAGGSHAAWATNKPGKKNSNQTTLPNSWIDDILRRYHVADFSNYLLPRSYQTFTDVDWLCYAVASFSDFVSFRVRRVPATEQIAKS